jgi:hypothetical protein
MNPGTIAPSIPSGGWVTGTLTTTLDFPCSSSSSQIARSFTSSRETTFQS